VIPLERLAVSLADLATGARTAAAFQAQRTQEGRFGSGRKELLMQRAFTIYDLTRHEHPESGPKIGMGKPLVNFMTAVLFGAGFKEKDVTQDVVKGAYQRWKQRHKPKRREALR
jgi:hypothetical protein